MALLSQNQTKQLQAMLRKNENNKPQAGCQIKPGKNISMSKQQVTANKKRFLLNVLLLLVFAVLFWLIFLNQQTTGPAQQTLYDASMGDEITQIVIHQVDKPDIHIQNIVDTTFDKKTSGPDTNEKKPGVWTITQPVKKLAAQDKLQHLFTLLFDPVSNSYDVTGKDLAKFGLDKEHLSVSFNGVKLVFGDYNDIAQSRYILKGETIYLVSETVSGLLESGLDGFIQNPVKTDAAEAE